MNNEWTIEQIREFVKKDYQSVSARMVKCLLAYFDELKKPVDEKRLFQVLDKMNVLDIESGSGYVGVCGKQNVLSVDKHGEKGIVKMGVPPEVPLRIMKGEDLRLVLLIVDGKKYDELSK